MTDNFTTIESEIVRWDEPLIDRTHKPVDKDELQRRLTA